MVAFKWNSVSLKLGVMAMIIQRTTVVLTIICALATITNGQEERVPWLEIGDAAPQLFVHRWIKGEPVEKFERNKIYILEFWATWCKPCIAAMPHLSELSVGYHETVVCLGIDIYERKSTTISKIRNFVDSIGRRWALHVGVEDSNLMEKSWIEASGAKTEGIPLSIVVNMEGKIAWIGHPHELEKILPEIIENTWDMNKALADRRESKHLKELELNASFELAKFEGDPAKPDDLGKPDSALAAINEILKAQPSLKYSTSIAAYTFIALLKTNTNKACNYGEELLAVTSFLRPLEYIIINNISFYESKIKFPPEIYRIGARAIQAEIDNHRDEIDISAYYKKMADWYRKANDEDKARRAEQNALDSQKKLDNISSGDAG